MKTTIYSVSMCQTLLSTKYLLLHLIPQLWGRYHGYINRILQMMKLKFIKVRTLAPAPTAGKQPGWMHTQAWLVPTGHASFPAGGGIRTQQGECDQWSAARHPAWSWLLCGHPTAMLSHLWQLPKNYITSVASFLSLYFGHPLGLTGKLQSSVSNSTRPWSHLKKNTPSYLRCCFDIYIYQLHICLNLHL